MKIVVVGDNVDGQMLSFIMNYVNPNYHSDFKPTGPLGCPAITINGKNHDVVIETTLDLENYEKLRLGVYNNTDAFIVLFSNQKDGSFENACNKWYQEIKRHNQKLPVLLVGTFNKEYSEEDITDRSQVNNFSIENDVPYLFCEVTKTNQVKEAFQKIFELVVEKKDTLLIKQIASDLKNKFSLFLSKIKNPSKTGVPPTQEMELKTFTNK